LDGHCTGFCSKPRPASVLPLLFEWGSVFRPSAFRRGEIRERSWRGQGLSKVLFGSASLLVWGAINAYFRPKRAHGELDDRRDLGETLCSGALFLPFLSRNAGGRTVAAAFCRRLKHLEASDGHALRTDVGRNTAGGSRNSCFFRSVAGRVRSGAALPGVSGPPWHG
jgi:hypothetical protein